MRNHTRAIAMRASIFIDSTVLHIELELITATLVLFYYSGVIFNGDTLEKKVNSDVCAMFVLQASQ